MKHHLKIRSLYFDEILSGLKKFEIRLDDRGYSVGDLLILNEYDDYIYSGRSLSVKVKSIHTGIGLLPNYIILTFDSFFDLI